MKTKEELNAIKEEVEDVNKKLAELTEDELKEVTGGGGRGRSASWPVYDGPCGHIATVMEGVCTDKQWGNPTCIGCQYS